MIRSRDHPTSLSWFSMCLPLRHSHSYHCQLCLIISPSPSLLALLIFGRHRDRGCQEWVCAAVLSLPSLPAVALHDAQTCFSRLAREVKEMRGAWEPPPPPTRHADTTRPGGLIQSRITVLSYLPGVTSDYVCVRKDVFSRVPPSVNNDIILPS